MPRTTDRPAAHSPPPRVHLRADEDAPARAREALGALASRLIPERRQTLELVTSELVTNAVRHGTAGPAQTISLEAAVEDCVVALTVIDPGNGFDPSAPRPEPGSAGGFGLYLVEELAESLSVRSRDATTQVTVRLAL